MFRLALALLCLLTVAPPAQGASCSYLVRKLRYTKGKKTVPLYKRLIDCSNDAAKDAFSSFVKAASEPDPIAELAILAIDNDITEPVLELPKPMTDDVARTQIVRAIGFACSEHKKVIPFLQGGYSSLTPGVFTQWGPAYFACKEDALVTWIRKTVEQPLSKQDDPKYNTLTGAYVKQLGPAALPSLITAAITAGVQCGPFASIIDHMIATIQPNEFGEDWPPEQVAELPSALVQVGQDVRPDQAKVVASHMVLHGYSKEAAKLLPHIYQGIITEDGLTYGVAAIENCSNEAIIHYTTATGMPSSYDPKPALSPLIRDVKSRLKCTPEGEWPVEVTPQPIGHPSQLESWFAELNAAWQVKGYTMSNRREKPIKMPE